ncbi:DUF1698 domain-containing protein, partial [Enterobacter hormaechei]|nr:DUF1698 domain-containing protein [Enterobacter hormaechei]
MIDFGNFYQLIAKNNLQHWLNCLPAQLQEWQKAALHGNFKSWVKTLENL